MADSKKYNGSTWEHSLRKLTTATEAVENPLYSDGTAITAYTISGNTVQNGTPTPSNPVDVNGVGELETTGEHTGEYKIPISNGQQTTNIYLGSTQTVRQIKKLVLTGEENWGVSSGTTVYYVNDIVSDYLHEAKKVTVCSHFDTQINTNSASNIESNTLCFRNSSDRLYINSPTHATTTDFTTFLQQQYAAGTPVTVWYVLAEPTTAIVNEPLHKIGDYADTLSNAASILTTEGANSITVDTTVQPSEFTATWTGWHDASVKEWDGSQWNE